MLFAWIGIQSSHIGSWDKLSVYSLDLHALYDLQQVLKYENSIELGCVQERIT